MQKIVLKFVNWLCKIFKINNMNTKFTTANSNYQQLRIMLADKLNQIETFLHGDMMLPSSLTYKSAVRKYKPIEAEGFSFSIHGKDFVVRPEYVELEKQGKVILSTYRTEPIYGNYPNLKLDKINSLDVQIDKTGNVFIGTTQVGNFPLDYFNSVSNYLYPES